MSEAIPVLIPHETVNDEVVVVGGWQVPSGEWVRKDQLVAEVETSKVLLEIHAPCEGFLRYSASKGAELPVGSPICYITPAADTPLPAAEAAPVKAMAAAAAGAGFVPSAKVLAPPTPKPPRPKGDFAGSGRFSHRASRLMEERGLDPEAFRGMPLVRASDVLARLEQPAAPAGGAKPDAGLHPSLLWEDLPRRKRMEVQYLRAGHLNALPSAVTVACATRGLRAAIRSSGIRAASPTPVIVFELARLLRKYPMFNAVYGEGRAGYYGDVNIGLAIDGGEGLIVPVIRHADRKSLHEIAAEIEQRVVEYLDRSLAPAALSGGTFTVSDLSAEGVVSFAPLINREQAAILGIGCEFFPPGSSQGLINLTLVFDHQLAEGRVAARLLQDLTARLTAYETALGGERAPAVADGPEEGEARCVLCLRDAAALKPIDGWLLRSAVPPGYICSLCLAGYN